MYAMASVRHSKATGKLTGRKRRKLPREARVKISAAQKARWAKIKKEKK
jgi:hypothetical protein